MVGDEQSVLALGSLPPAAHSGEGPVAVARVIAVGVQDMKGFRITAHMGSFSWLELLEAPHAAFKSSVLTNNFNACKHF